MLVRARCVAALILGMSAALLACVARVTVCRITGKLTKEELLKSLQSWTGHAEHADSYNLRAKINASARTASGKGAGE